nr:hypothetical protein [Tanacetum cinerariifolium]
MRANPSDTNEAVTENPPAHPKRLRPREWVSKHRQPIGLGVTIILFAIALIACRHMLMELDIYALQDSLLSVPLPSLTGAVLATAIGFVILLGYEWSASRYANVQLPAKSLVMGGFCAFAIGNAVGLSMLSGGSVRYRLYSRLGLGAGEVAHMTLFASLSLGCALPPLAALATLSDLPAASLALHLSVPVLAISAVAILAISAILGYAVYRRRLPEQTIPHNLLVRAGRRTLRLPGVRLTLMQLVITALDVAAAAAVLYLLLPSAPPFGAFLLVYLLALAAGVLSHVPGGRGQATAVRATGHARRFGARRPDSGAAGVSLWRGLAVFRVDARDRHPPREPGLPDSAPADRRIPLRCKSDWRPLPVARAGLAPPAFRSVDADHHPAVRRVHPVDPQRFRLGGSKPAADDRVPAGNLPPLVLPAESLAGIAILAADVPYSHQLWWQFTLDADAPRGLRSALGSAVLLLIVSLTWLLRTARPVINLPDEAQLAKAAEIIKASSQPDGGLVLTGDKAVLMHPDGNAFLMYAHRGRSLVALYDPIGPTQQRAELIWQFRDLCDVHHARPVFYQVRAENLPFYMDIGLTSSDLAVRKVKVHVGTRTGREALASQALHDPIGPTQQRAELIWQFRDLCDVHHARPVFYQVRAENLPFYMDIGLTAIKLGEEARVDLLKFDIEAKGKEMKDLRYTWNRGGRDGLSLEIYEVGQAPMEELKVISDAWLTGKNVREKGFSLGRFSLEYLKHFRIAIVHFQGKPVAPQADHGIHDGRAHPSLQKRRLRPFQPGHGAVVRAATSTWRTADPASGLDGLQSWRTALQLPGAASLQRQIPA